MYQHLAQYANLSEGPQVLICYANYVTMDMFANLLLFAIWCIMSIGSYMIQRKTTGLGDFPMSLMIGSWVTTIGAIILRLIDCGSSPMISGITLAVCIVVSMASLVIMLFTHSD